MTRFSDWDPPLKLRRGSAVNLLGIEVYHDFPWSTVVPHGRTQFSNGQCLARLARENCGGKTPALLLTNKAEELEGPFETATHHFVVVNLERYVDEATPNAAVSYLSRRMATYAAHVAQVEMLATRPDLVRAALTVEEVVRWFTDDATRPAEVWSAMADAKVATVFEPAQLVADLQTLAALDAEVMGALAALVGAHEDRDTRLRLIRKVTEDADGRSVTTEVLAERTAERIADARNATSRYQVLLNDPGTGETAMQAFIEDNLWLLGLDYARIIPHAHVIGGTPDFALERLDGFQDILELKSPQDSLIQMRQPPSGGMPPPSAYSLSPALSLALAQAHAYRDRMNRFPEVHEELFGLRYTRDPRLIIVIGRVEQLAPSAARVLQEINKSLHRVEIVGYDILLRRATALLDNIEKYLLTETPGPEPSPVGERQI